MNEATNSTPVLTSVSNIPPAPGVPSVAPPVPATPSVTPSALPTRLSDADMQNLERQNNKRQLTQARAEKAVADAEVSELQYKNLIMQLFMAYNLGKNDSISQDGSIVRGNVNADVAK